MCCGPVKDKDKDKDDNLCVAGLLPASVPACSSAACKQAAVLTNNHFCGFWVAQKFFRSFNWQDKNIFSFQTQNLLEGVILVRFTSLC